MQSETCPLNSAISRFLPVTSLLLACGLTLSACHSATREQPNAQAADEWTRSYPLDSGGSVAIINRNGAIEIEGVDGATVEVRAERVTHAATARTAQELLSKIGITEDIKPDLVSIRTQGIEGILLGVSFEVTYHVKVPRSAIVRVVTATGDITVTGIGSRLVANTTSGNILGTNLTGGVETRTVNGSTNIALARLGTDPVTLRATNGSIKLELPASSDANLTASCVNGEVSITGPTFEPTGEPGPERARNKRVKGRLNKGGTPIELQTVNGGIVVVAPAAPVKAK